MIKAALLALLALAVSPPVVAATPDIHAPRGGTVKNGTPRFAEESMRAYRKAALNGFVLEVDAKLTEDGVPVAIHDATLERTTNCTGEVRTFTLAELGRCKIDFPAGSAPISTIDRLLRFARISGAEVNLEIKNVPTDPDFDSTPAFANRVMDAVLASRIPRRQLIIQSFIASNLDVSRQRLPGVTTSLLAIQALNEPYLQTASTNRYDLISPEWPVSAEYVRRAHDMGLGVAPFTLDEAADVRAARRAGVDALITDDPLMAARALGLRPARFNAGAYTAGNQLVGAGKLVPPRGVSVRKACRGTVTMRVLAEGRPTRTARGRVNRRRCEFFISTRRPPARLGRPLVTIRFNGNKVLLPRLDGPERARRAPAGAGP